MGTGGQTTSVALLNGHTSKQRLFFIPAVLMYPYEPKIIDRYILRFSPPLDIILWKQKPYI